MWYTRVILPCSCPNTVGFADFSHLALLGCLTVVGPCSRRSLLCSRSCFQPAFSCVAVGRFAPQCHTGLSLEILGLKGLFFCQERVLVAEVGWAQAE